jgi:two-component system response regulator AlgR
VAIVDDEELARGVVREFLRDEPGVQIVAECANGFEAVKAVSDLKPDLLLLDVQMPGADGFALLERLDPRPAVIFVTAYDQYAVTAFDLSAVDYLLKPVRIARLADALRKVARTPTTGEALRQAGERLAPGGRRQLRCSERGKVLLVPAAEVIYFRADLKYVVARTAEREYLLEESLAQLEQEFGDRLLRIHRNCLVARQAIRGFEREREAAAGEGEAHWVLLLHGVPEHLPVSRRQWPQVKAALGG